MRILHTSDWHLGRTLEGRSRLEEQEQFLIELGDLVEQEKVNLVLVAGDIFDSANPPAAAEQLFYEAVDELAAGGRRAVVIVAGNHDSPERLKAAAPLANRSGIILAGLPGDLLISSHLTDNWQVRRLAGGPSWLEIMVPDCDYPAVIVALPYPSESRLREALVDTVEDEEIFRRAYSQRVALFFSELGKNFRPNAVNLVVSHLFVRGGKESDSERPIHLGGALAVDADALPVQAQYIALGHLHRPQSVLGTSAMTRYSGAPLAYSFSEAGQAKSVILVEARPGEAALAREIFLSSGRPLVKWVALEGISQVRCWIEEKRDADAWIDLEVHVTDSIPLRESSELRNFYPGIVNIRPVLPEMEEITSGKQRTQLPLEELFHLFYSRQTGGGQPEEELVRLFMELASEGIEE